MKYYTPKNLELWTRPNCYMGESWPEYYSSGFGQSRDSDCLEESNFATVVAALEAVEYNEDEWEDDPPFQVVRESHWAVGWVEWIAIHQDAGEHLKVADKLAGSYKSYPALDEDDWSERALDAANKVWSDCYNDSERVQYIRDNREQFDFYNFADLLAVARGNYFSGYANELLY